MAEVTEIRLVRCPRCGNLLTELPGFALYKCGGCGVVLEARKKGIIDDGLLEMSNDIKGARISAECSLLNMPGIGMERIDGIERIRMERLNNKKMTSTDISMYRSENAELLADFDGRRGNERIRRMEYYDDENRPYHQGLIHNGKHGEYRNLDMNIPEYVNFQGGQRRYDNFSYHDEGSSSYEVGPHYEQTDKTRHRDRDLNARVEILEHNRVELLRKLDELKDQLNHSHIINDRPKERMVSLTPRDPYGRLHDAYAQEGLNSPHGVNKKPLSSKELESSYLAQIHGYLPSPGRYVSGAQDSYSPRDFRHEFNGDTPPRHQLQHEDVFGYSENTNHIPITLNPRENFYHEPSCSCVRCCNRNLDIPSKTDHYLHEPYSRNIHHHLYPVLHVPRDNKPGGSNLHSRLLQTLNSKDLDYMNDGFSNHHYRKANAAHRRGRFCHPISGGAPFITCCNCFELLKLPRKHGPLANKQQIKCGSCFSVILFELGSKGTVTSVSTYIDPVSTDINHSSNDLDMNICNIKCENSVAYPFPTDDKSNYTESEKRLDPVSSISTISVHEHNADTDKKSNYEDTEKQLNTLSTSADKHNADLHKKSNYDELEKQLDPSSAASNISLVKHSTIDNSNSNMPEKQLTAFSANLDITENEHNTAVKSNSYNPEKQAEPVSTTSIVSVDERNISTDANSNYDEPKKQFDPRSAPLNVSLNTHSTDTNEKSNFDGFDKQRDSLSAALNISVDEHSTDTDEESNYDEFGKPSNPIFANSSLSVDERHTGNVTFKKQCNFPQVFPDQCSDNNIGSQSQKGNESKQAETTLGPSISMQNLANDDKTTAVTNMSVSKFSNSCRSQDSVEIHEEDHPIANLGSKPFIEGDAQDFPTYNQNLEIEESKVFVNGHFIPDHEVQKAEKLAGRIQPGEYWYDYQAGFWGVMGHPCLGIIMPNIEEFNYPLPEDCAAGDTGVVVNGRELHHKDLDILASRGLPALRYGSYAVEISGKVMDNHTGEELVDLGKLAPTVEKQNCGFGMRVP